VYHRPSDNFRLDDRKLLFSRLVEAERVPLSAFVQEDSLESVGKFLETELETGLPMPKAIVFVKVKKGSGHPGESYLAVKDHGVIRKMNQQVDGAINARFVEVAGSLQLVEQVKANFKDESEQDSYDVFRARVVHAISLTLTDYELIPGQMEFVDL